ncbi:repeat element protein-d10.2 [Ichnoviriform fugitivi]|uniref:Repeat element protein-d10.2 n=1 Tax=Ichnoviriform fugitivi TaxID=265522 RepID=A2Q0M6_9VIRU|nr:repeat element protein-d10.2 [Ichnoviriform fugitivi]BAF45741.1 repeat element protein-d10.2 [Ichnoviriform fugitivi]
MNPQDSSEIANGNGKRIIVLQEFLALSTATFTATFFDGKPLEVEYIFDASRGKEDRILVNVNCLLPVLGGITVPGMNKYASISELNNLVVMHVHLNMCSNREHASCSCHLLDDYEGAYESFVKPEEVQCPRRHFHHYCWGHVVSWLQHYLHTIILYRESRELFDEEIAEHHLLLYREDRQYFRTGERPMSVFLLKNAQEMFFVVPAYSKHAGIALSIDAAQYLPSTRILK